MNKQLKVGRFKRWQLQRQYARNRRRNLKVMCKSEGLPYRHMKKQQKQLNVRFPG